MGLDIFLQAFENSQPQLVPTARVLACFAEFVSQRTQRYIDVRFGPDDSCTIYVDTAEPSISSLMVSRPCGSPRLAECLFDAMNLGNFVLFVPGEDNPVVVRRETIEHIPSETTESLGQPVVMDSREYFVAAFLNPKSQFKPQPQQ